MTLGAYGALAVAVLLSVFIASPAKSTGTEITGTDVEIIYGFAGFTGINDTNPSSAVGFQIWNPSDRYGHGWIASTSPISDSDLMALTPGSHTGGLFGRTPNGNNDGSFGFDRWEWNNAPLSFDTAYFFKVGIFDSTGALVDSESIQIPAITKTGSPSNHWSDMPVFYPAGSVNPYAPGGLYYDPPLPPTVSAPELVGQEIEIDVKFEDPETLTAIQHSTDNGATWLTGEFTATSFGSVLSGTVNISQQSSGASLRVGDTYKLKIRGLNDSRAGSGSNASCIVLQSGSLKACPSTSSPHSSKTSTPSPPTSSTNSTKASTAPSSPQPEENAEVSSIEVATASGDIPTQSDSPVALWVIGFFVVLALGASAFVAQRKYNFKPKLLAKKK